MGQREVYNLLKKTGKWMEEKEVSKILKVSSSNYSLNKLYKVGEVFRRISKRWKRPSGMPYEYKIR